MKDCGPNWGYAILNTRKANDLTQEKLAAAAGVTQRYISHLETGRTNNPSYVVVLRVANALGLKPEELYHIASTHSQGCEMPSGQVIEGIRRFLETGRTPHDNHDHKKGG